MKFTKVPVNTMEALQVNAGIVVDEFTPASGTIGSILGATGGGVEFDPKPTFVDRGEGIDNMPANTWQLKDIDHFEPHLTGTFKTMSDSLAKLLQGGSALASGHIIPGNQLREEDFEDVWLVGDYSNVNNDGGTGSSAKAGFVAIHLKNAMNVLGFRWKTNDKDKADFAFDFQGHYDITDIDEIPFEIYVVEGTAGS